METEQAREKVLLATVAAFEEKGLKFTMDDVARNAQMSKKTVYVLFEDKKALMNAMVEHSFSSIKEAERAVLEDESLDTVQKISRLLGVMPVTLKGIDLRKLKDLKDSYPDVYKNVAAHLESDWEPTIALLKQGMEEGKFRTFSIPVFQAMLEATIESFFASDVLERSELTYNEALDELTRIMVEGILK